ncbi:hypothetical protein Nepgr_033111 [Nepenthes gracilis]|uniref:Uncharacterized protein n=1 Tax=Nepenthes gracilis TaxID=150966 RepID=A0AAD3TLQ1_NEPGR|nr:hypothetical protein Nepgr_033111 [Nepenthes gracilis]
MLSLVSLICPISVWLKHLLGGCWLNVCVCFSPEGLCYGGVHRSCVLMMGLLLANDSGFFLNWVSSFIIVISLLMSYGVLNWTVVEDNPCVAGMAFHFVVAHRPLGFAEAFAS